MNRNYYSLFTYLYPVSIFLTLNIISFKGNTENGIINKATVTLVRGNVFEVLIDGTEKALQKGDEVFENSNVKTVEKSLIQFKIWDGSKLNLGPNSQLILSEMPSNRPSIVSLIKGHFRAQIIKNSNEGTQDNNEENSKFFVKTNSAAIGVRGTDFIVGYNSRSKATNLDVVSGKVALVNDPNFGRIKLNANLMNKMLNAKNAILIGEGMRSSVYSPNRAPSSPVRIPPSVFEKLKKSPIQMINRVSRKSKESKETKESKEINKTKDIRESRGSKGSKEDSKNPPDSQESRDSQDGKGSKSESSKSKMKDEKSDENFKEKPRPNNFEKRESTPDRPSGGELNGRDERDGKDGKPQLKKGDELRGLINESDFQNPQEFHNEPKNIPSSMPNDKDRSELKGRPSFEKTFSNPGDRMGSEREIGNRPPPPDPKSIKNNLKGEERSSDGKLNSRPLPGFNPSRKPTQPMKDLPSTHSSPNMLPPRQPMKTMPPPPPPPNSPNSLKR